MEGQARKIAMVFKADVRYYDDFKVSLGYTEKPWRNPAWKNQINVNKFKTKKHTLFLIAQFCISFYDSSSWWER